MERDCSKLLILVNNVSLHVYTHFVVVHVHFSLRMDIDYC